MFHLSLRKKRRIGEGKGFKKETKIFFEVVHFADSMGLDLVQVKCVFPYNSSDEELLSSSPSLLIKPLVLSFAFFMYSLEGKCLGP